MALFLDLELGDALRIGDDTVVRLEAKSGKRARLRIESPADVKHLRGGEEAKAGLTRPAPAEPMPAPAGPKQSVFFRRPSAG